MYNTYGKEYILEDTDIRGEHLRVFLLDTDRFIKANELKEVSNPITFQRNNIPTPDGLLSNEIFGITMYDRSNTCAYIDLYEPFLTPLVYKVWGKLDKKIVECVHGIRKFVINSKGELEPNEDGESGVKFLKKNIERINIARTASVKRDLNVDFLEKCKKDKGMFVTKCIVLPAFYRDVDTSNGGKVAIGEINALYRNLIIAARSLKESRDYGLDMSDATRGRIQESLVSIYNWFGMGTTVNGVATGANIPGKRGVLRRAIMSKTTDYASRLVITAPELKYETIEDFQTDLDHALVPLASVLTNFQPFVVFWIRRFFEEAFSGGKGFPDENDPNKIIYCKDYQMQFSEEAIRKQIHRFLTGASNRLIAVEFEDTEGKKNNIRFKGFNMSRKEYEENREAGTNLPILDRFLTWCDIFYMAATDVTKDKHVIVVRYPIDKIYNQFPVRVRVNSTNKTEPMVVDGVFYPHYPYIRQELIGTDTSHMFIDSLNISNLYLDGMGGDYDGDQVTCKGVFTREANAELDKVMQSNYNYIDTGGKGIRKATNEAVQAMYSMTMVLPADKDKLTKPKF